MRSRCRSSKKCPVCRAEVIHVPRHLRNCHGWTPEEARTAVRKFKLQTVKKQKSKQKDYHHRRQCPVDGCTASVKRLSSHLQSHKIAAGSLKYKRLLAKARTDFKQCTTDATGMMFDSMSHNAPESVSHSVLLSSAAAPEQQNDGSPPAVDRAAAGMLLVSDSHTAFQSVSSATAVEQENSESAVTTAQPVVNNAEEDTSADDDVSRLHDSAERVLMNDDHATQLHKFMTWMMSPDGGLKNIKSAKQHMTQIRAILKITGEQSLSALWDNSVLDAFTSYAKVMKYLPATSKSYLNSLKHFYHFVTAASIVTGDDVQQVTRMLERVKHWIAAYRKQCSKHTQQKMNEDLNRLIQPEQVEAFRKSECALSAIKTLGSLTDDSQLVVTQTDYVLVRDFLLTEIALTNANRSGVLSNMTLKQFKIARKVEDQFVVSVDDHKTSATYGPAKVVLSPSLHSWLLLYVDKLRIPLFSSNSADDAMFVTWNGESMSSGQITKCIQSIWRKAGLGEGISMNIMRKSAVSSVHQNRPEISSQLADLMCHRLTTAQKCYRVVEREKSSVVASMGLREAMSSTSRAVSNEQNSAIAETVPSTSASESQAVCPSTDRFIWDSQKLFALKAHFQSNITAGTVTLESVREKLKGIEELSSFSCRQVYDKLRSEMRSKSADHSDVFLPAATDTSAERAKRLLLGHSSATVSNAISSEDESDESCIPPSSRAKDIFGKEDIKTIVKLCASVIARGAISEERVRSVLSETSAGTNLLKKYTLFQLKNRLKYERRKCSKH